jgi:hypothetical protein
MLFHLIKMEREERKMANNKTLERIAERIESSEHRVLFCRDLVDFKFLALEFEGVAVLCDNSDNILRDSIRNFGLDF